MPSETQKTKRPVIFLIEDDVFMIELLAQELDRAGYEIISFRFGKEAMEALINRRPDLILLDVLLPDSNGLDLLREIRAMPQGPEIRVIVLSNIAEGIDKDEAKRLGALDYLIKANFSLPEIITKIKSFVPTGS